MEGERSIDPKPTGWAAASRGRRTVSVALTGLGVLLFSAALAADWRPPTEWLFRWETALSVGAFLVGMFVDLASRRTTTRGFASWAIGAVVAPFLVTALALVIERILWADRPELVFPLYVAAIASFFAAAFVLPRPPARRPTTAEQVKALRYVAILAAVAGVGGLLVGYQGVMLAVIGLPVAVGCVLAAQLVARRGTAPATS